MSVEAWLKGQVSRWLPQAQVDNQPDIARLSRYQDVFVIPAVRKQHALADEGSYFICNNGAGLNGLATAAAQSAYSATASGFILIVNTDSPSNSNAKRIHLDWAQLICTAVGTAGTAIFAAVDIDQGNRYSSGGTELSNNILSPNMDISQRGSVARVWSGGASALTLTAATGSKRTVVAGKLIKNAIGVANDLYFMNFGGVENVENYQAATTIIRATHMPPVVVGPNESAIIHIWLPTQSAASSYAPELGWWER